MRVHCFLQPFLDNCLCIGPNLKAKLLHVIWVICFESFGLGTAVGMVSHFWKFSILPFLDSWSWRWKIVDFRQTHFLREGCLKPKLTILAMHPAFLALWILLVWSCFVSDPTYWTILPEIYFPHFGDIACSGSPLLFSPLFSKVWFVVRSHHHSYCFNSK